MPQNLEIERKFVVNPNHPEWTKVRDSQKGRRLIQATIHKEAGYKLRIRMIEDLETGERSSFFCFKVSVKGSITDPTVRDEYEWPVPDRSALYMMIGHGEISKIRRTYTDTNGLVFEIDEYEGSNRGIITADVEMIHLEHAFEKPAFLGWEVTNDERLKNSTLQNLEQSFSTWSQEQKSWYEKLCIGDGVSIYPTTENKIKNKISLWMRFKNAYRAFRQVDELYNSQK